MHQLVIGIASEILAVFILYLVSTFGPSSIDIFSESQVYLDVESQNKVVSQVKFTTVRAYNKSKYGFDPIKFEPLINKSPLLITLAGPFGQEAHFNPDPTFSRQFTLGRGEKFEAIIVSTNKIYLKSPEDSFSGKYSAPGALGLQKALSIEIRRQADSTVASYGKAALAITGLVISAVCIIAGGNKIYRWLKGQ